MHKKLIPLAVAIVLGMIAPLLLAVPAQGAVDSASRSSNTKVVDLGELYSGAYRFKQELKIKKVFKLSKPQAEGKTAKKTETYVYWKQPRNKKKSKYAILIAAWQEEGASINFKYKKTKKASWTEVNFTIKESPELEVFKTGEPKEVGFTNTYDDPVKVEFYPEYDWDKEMVTPVTADPAATATTITEDGGTINWNSSVWFRGTWIRQHAGHIYKVPKK